MTRYAVHRLEDGAKALTINYELAVARRGFRLGLRAQKVGARPEITMLRVDNTRQGFFEADEFQGVLGHLPCYLKPVAIRLHHRLAHAKRIAHASVAPCRSRCGLVEIGHRRGQDPARAECFRSAPSYARRLMPSANTSTRSSGESAP